MSVFSWYSSKLLSGRSRAILQGLSYCLKDIMCAFPSRLALGIHLTGMWWSAPLLWLLGCRRCDAWSEVLLQRPGLSKGPAVKTENQIHNFLVFDNPPTPPPRLPHPIQSRPMTARLERCRHFKVTSARTPQIICGGLLSLVVCLLFRQQGIQICLKKSKPRTCLHQFVLSRPAAQPQHTEEHILSQDDHRHGHHLWVYMSALYIEIYVSISS